MSLLVTSITMGQQPDRLLDKGPQYLRTRTNRGLFAHHRKSAVELLAASKSQFYKCPSISLDDANHVTSTSSSGVLGQSETGTWQEKKPSRSKSEFDISALKSLISHEANDDIYDDSDTTRENVQPEQAKRLSSYLKEYRPKKTDSVALENQHQTKDRFDDLHFHQNQVIKNKVTKDRVHPELSTERVPCVKPVPVPRKNRNKPVPPPRKPSLGQVPSSSLRPEVVDKSRKHSLDSNENYKESNNYNVAHNKNKGSLVANLRRRFNSIGANVPFSNRTKEWTDVENTNQDVFTQKSENREKGVTYQAIPIFIPKPESIETQSCNEATKLSPAPRTNSSHSFNDEDKQSKSCVVDNNLKGRKRYQEASMSNKSHNKRERKGSNTDSNTSTVEHNSNKTEDSSSPEMSSTLNTPGVIVEMSIESVDQAVCCDSEVNAIPAAVTTSADSLTGENSNNNNKVDVNRKKQSISGKMDVSLHESSLRPSHSPSHFIPSMPRSHSDIGCRLEVESQHSRDSSLVSNHSRLSRASAGADLEQFFNQMGLEKGVLEPLNRLRELQNSEVLASVSSLNSNDAASICSSFSADNDNSESQALECAQHPTSVVERNARIIKWLCNVRKAKTHPLRSEAVTLSDPHKASTGVGENG